MHRVGTRRMSYGNTVYGGRPRMFVCVGYSIQRCHHTNCPISNVGTWSRRHVLVGPQLHRYYADGFKGLAIRGVPGLGDNPMLEPFILAPPQTVNPVEPFYRLLCLATYG